MLTDEEIKEIREYVDLWRASNAKWVRWLEALLDELAVMASDLRDAQHEVEVLEAASRKEEA